MIRHHRGGAEMRLRWRKTAGERTATNEPIGTRSLLPKIDRAPRNDHAVLVDQMIGNHRSALLLRPKLAKDLEPRSLQQAVERFRQDTCLISAGRVQLERWRVDTDANSAPSDSTDCVDVDAVFVERLAVTNGQYQAFVDQGGYEQKSLWHTSVWPAVKDFVDRTGMTGPKFWEEGCHAASKADHPVVGVCWFEAAAYARWIGMRLLTDAEWVRVACAPIEADGGLVQRKYPWGNSFSNDKANLWTSSVGHSVPVADYAVGDTRSGVRQMIGNVWEWTSSNLRLWSGSESIELSEPMKSLRGGAFDSYLESRATCECRSADSPLARRHNIGFRCAVSARDVIVAFQQPAGERPR